MLLLERCHFQMIYQPPQMRSRPAHLYGTLSMHLLECRGGMVFYRRL